MTRNRTLNVTALSLAVGCLSALPCQYLWAATVVQPDIQVGVTHVTNGGMTGDEDFSATGGEFDARLNIGFVDERGSVTLTPSVRFARFSDENVTDREEQRLQFNWFRNFQTAASNTVVDFLRQDLFSSEFRDQSLDPDQDPDNDTVDSGVVNADSTRNRIRFHQDFAKAIGQRSHFIFAANYIDISYDDAETTGRVDFDEIRLDAGFRRALNERVGVFLRVGAERYDGDNGLTTDGFGGGFGVDVDYSETSTLFAAAGYQTVDAEDEFQSLGSDNAFIFRVGGRRTTELTRFRVQVDRDVRPTSIGGVTTETGLSLFVDRKLSQRVSLGVGLRASAQDRNRATAIDDDRDYLSGQLQLSWRVSRQWAVEANARYRRQEFDSAAILNGQTAEDRSRFLLSLRYRGLREVPVSRDRRFFR